MELFGKNLGEKRGIVVLYPDNSCLLPPSLPLV